MWHILIGFTLGLSSCAADIQWAPLPHNLKIVAPDRRIPAEVQALSGAWMGTWLGGPTGAAGGVQGDGLLVVEEIDRHEAVVVYAWKFAEGGERGWVRENARVLPGPGIEWNRDAKDYPQGIVTFTFLLNTDGNGITGKVRRGTEQRGFIRLFRVPADTLSARMPITPTSGVATDLGLALPPLPKVAIDPSPPDLAPELTAFSGTWEGTWDTGMRSRLVIYRMGRELATVLYAWSDAPQGSAKGGYIRRVAIVYEDDRKIMWGVEPKFTFRIGENGQKLEGKREWAGQFNRITMTRVPPRE